jgi:hypothetical protein
MIIPPESLNPGNTKLTTVSSVLPKPFPDDGWVQLIPTNVPFFTKVSANPKS